MVIEKYNIDIDNKAINANIDRLINQTFKLLPLREEGGDWDSTLRNIILEITGMNELLNQQVLFSLLCKMEALALLKNEEDFLLFRKLIFECIGLMEKIKKCL